MSTELGRLFVRLQSVIPGLDFHSEKERDEFLEAWSKRLPESMRQQVLVWRNNQVQKQAEKVKAEEEAEKGKPEPSSVPEVQRRERERAAATRAAEAKY